VWADLEKQYGSELNMVVVDRDTKEGREFAESHRIYYQPAFVVLDPTGKVTYAELGPYDPRGVTELVEKTAAQ